MNHYRALLLAVALAPFSTLAADPIFEEKGGIVVIEAESTKSSLGRWIKKTDVEGFTGDCHLEFTGNKPENGPPQSPLKYRFRINQAGKYQLTLRARKRLESKRQDISNDCYIALKGDFTSGGEAPLAVLRKDTKMFGGNADGWGWTLQLDEQHKKYPAIYELKAGETYELTISGRSKNFNIDRILLTHESANLRQTQNGNPAQSETAGGLPGSGVPSRRPVRELTNEQGRKVTAELMGKEGDTLIALIGGRRFEIPISSLSKADQEFLKDWKPGN